MMSVEELLKKLKARYGGIVTVPCSQPEREKLPSGILMLDYLLRGGYTQGKIYLLNGEWGSGKSLTAMMASIEALKKYPEKCVAYFDFECTFDVDSAVPTEQKERFIRYGFDPEKYEGRLQIVRPNNIEDFFHIAQKMAESGEYSLIIIDSVAEAPTSLHLEKEEKGQDHGRDDKPRIISFAIRTLKMALFRNRTTLLAVMQPRDRMDVMFGNPTIMSGGRALPLASSGIINLKKKDLVVNPDMLEIGMVIGVFIEKYKDGVPIRFRKKGQREYAEFILNYEIGIDNKVALMEVGLITGAVVQGGARIQWKDVSVYKKDFLAVVEEAGRYDEFVKDIYRSIEDEEVEDENIGHV